MPGADPSRPWRHLYGRKWEKRRLSYLAKHPLCVKCAETGRVEAATVVDHVKPHKGDTVLFWDRSNWQSLCKRCHDGWKQREERRGDVSTCDVEGYRTDGSW